MDIKDKPYERSNLLVSFGILIQPLETLAKSKPVPEIEDYRTAFAMVSGGERKFLEQVDKFATFKEIKYFNENLAIKQLFIHFNARYRDTYNDSKMDQNILQNLFHIKLIDFKKNVVEKILSIPIDWAPKLFEANTPYTTHLCIRDYIAGVQKRLDYFDRYLNPDFFCLYLRDLDRSIPIRLVTTKNAVKEVSSISDLCRQEFNNYKLIQLEPSEFHDRNLRIDDKIFTLGPGTAHAGRYPTNFGPAESTPSSHQTLNELIDKGTIIHEST